MPTSSDACQNIVINNEILYYISAHARYSENKNLGKLQVLTKGSLMLTMVRYNVMKSSGFHEVLWDVMFHSNIQDVLKANHDILDLVVPGDIPLQSMFLQMGSLS